MNNPMHFHVEQVNGAKDVDITSTKSIPANMMASLAQATGQKSHEKATDQSIFKDVMTGNSPGFSEGQTNS